jgi:hypothetical protein
MLHLPLITEAATGNTGMNLPAFPFYIPFPQLLFYFFQLNFYTTIHGYDYILAHSDNQEIPTPMLHLPLITEAATESFYIPFPQLFFLFFPVKLLHRHPRPG